MIGLIRNILGVLLWPIRKILLHQEMVVIMIIVLIIVNPWMNKKAIQMIIAMGQTSEKIMKTMQGKEV